MTSRKAWECQEKCGRKPDGKKYIVEAKPSIEHSEVTVRERVNFDDEDDIVIVWERD